MKRVIVITICLILAAAFCLCLDFNSYETASKTILCREDGLIFSVTSFDGETESEPFVKCLGHSWVSIDNRSEKSVFLKDYEIKSGEMLSFSIWAISGNPGVYFNLEPEFIERFGRYHGRQSLSMNIDEAQLKTIETYIDANNTWKATRNCSYWSIHLWNELAAEDHRIKTQTLLYTPERLQKSFGEYDCIEINKDFSRAEAIFSYRDGARTEFELCL